MSRNDGSEIEREYKYYLPIIKTTSEPKFNVPKIIEGGGGLRNYKVPNFLLSQSGVRGGGPTIWDRFPNFALFFVISPKQNTWVVDAICRAPSKVFNIKEN